MLIVTNHTIEDKKMRFVIGVLSCICAVLLLGYSHLILAQIPHSHLFMSMIAMAIVVMGLIIGGIVSIIIAFES